MKQGSTTSTSSTSLAVLSERLRVKVEVMTDDSVCRQCKRQVLCAVNRLVGLEKKLPLPYYQSEETVEQTVFDILRQFDELDFSSLNTGSVAAAQAHATTNIVSFLASLVVLGKE